MSSGSRARAKQYSMQVTDQRRARRDNMPNTFVAPSPGFSSTSDPKRFRGDEEQDAKESATIRSDERDQRDDAEKDVVDTRTFQPGTKTGKAPTPITTTTGSDFSDSNLKSAFRKCWTMVDELNIPPVNHYDKSGYVPCAISIFQCLFDMELVLNKNEELRWICPHYFSLPVRVYYSVIFYIQVLRAREQSGTLTKTESSFLRAFFRNFKDTSCPIAGPLVPIFTNLVSVLPDDDQFEYVYPSIPTKGTYSTDVDKETKQQKLTIDPLHYMVPSIPMLGSMLKQFTQANGLDDKFFDHEATYLPVPTTGGDFAGITFPPRPNDGYKNQFAQILHNPAMMVSLPESRARLREIHPSWRRASVRHFPDIQSGTSFNPEGPADITMLQEYFGWFEQCVNMAVVQAKFFADSTNLSNIPVTGNRSSLIISDLIIVDPKTGKAKPRPTKDGFWFPNVFDSVESTFKAMTADLDQDEKYNAGYSLTNSTLNWTDSSDNRTGSKEAGHRTGPYWDNSKLTFELAHPTPVMRGLYTMIQTQFYNAKPNTQL